MSTEALFYLPELPDISVVAENATTCKQSLQVAPNVDDMAVGDVVEGEYGPAAILDIEISKWRFSEKPKHRLTFLDYSSEEEYARSYFPWSPIKDNHAYEARFSGAAE